MSPSTKPTPHPSKLSFLTNLSLLSYPKSSQVSFHNSNLSFHVISFGLGVCVCVVVPWLGFVRLLLFLHSLYLLLRIVSCGGRLWPMVVVFRLVFIMRSLCFYTYSCVCTPSVLWNSQVNIFIRLLSHWTPNLLVRLGYDPWSRFGIMVVLYHRWVDWFHNCILWLCH